MVVEKSTDMGRRRSPSFPSYSLREAVKRLGSLFEKEKTHAVDRDTAAKAIGYSSIANGSAGRMISTLQHFGLIEATGHGIIRISQLGLKYLRPIHESDKVDAIVEAYRNPPLYAEVIDKFGSSVSELPSESTLRNWLLREEKLLTEDSAEKFVAAFFESAEFHEESNQSLTKRHSDENESRSVVALEHDDEDTQAPLITGPTKSASASFDIPHKSGFNLSGTLSATVTVTLNATGAMGAKELRRLKIWLETIAVPSVTLAIQSCEEEESLNLYENE